MKIPQKINRISMSVLDQKMSPKWHQNGAKWPPGISRKIPEIAPGATKGRYDAASSPQDHPRTSIGPPLDPKVPPGSSKRRTQDLQKTPKGPPQSAPKAPPKEPQRIPKKDLQIGSPFSCFPGRARPAFSVLRLGPYSANQ